MCARVCLCVRVCVSVRVWHCRDWAVRDWGVVFQRRFRSRGSGGHKHRHPHPLRRAALSPAGTLIGRAGRAARARRGPRAPARRRERALCLAPPWAPSAPHRARRPEGTRPSVPVACPRCLSPSPPSRRGAPPPRPRASSAPYARAAVPRAGTSRARPDRPGRSRRRRLMPGAPRGGRASRAPEGEEQECGDRAKGAPRCELTLSVRAGLCGAAAFLSVARLCPVEGNEGRAKVGG